MAAPLSHRLLGNVMVRSPAAEADVGPDDHARPPHPDARRDLLADPTSRPARRRGRSWPARLRLGAPIAGFMGGVFASSSYRCRPRPVPWHSGSGDVRTDAATRSTTVPTRSRMRDQPWFDGRLATYGPSHLGFTQWALLMDPPPELMTGVVMVGRTTSRRRSTQAVPSQPQRLPGGPARSRQEDHGIPAGVSGRGGRPRPRRARRWSSRCSKRAAPPRRGRSPWYHGSVLARRQTTPSGIGSSRRGGGEREVPVLIQTGWQDLFLPQPLEQSPLLSERGADVGPTVGPWTHISMMTGGPLGP